MKKNKNLIIKNKYYIYFIPIMIAVIAIITTVAVISKNKKNAIDTCVIVFNTNGGTLIQNQQIKCNTIALKPNNPEKKGFEFENWFLDEKPYDFSNLVTKNIELVAKYNVIEGNETIIVSFETFGGTSVDSIEVVKGTKLIEPKSPYFEGYEFKGWYFNDKLFDFDSVISDNILLEAKWVKMANTDSQKEKRNQSNVIDVNKEKGNEKVNQSNIINMNSEEDNEKVNIENRDEKHEVKTEKYDYINPRPADEIIKCQYDDFSYDSKTGYCYDLKHVKAIFGCPNDYNEDNDGRCYHENISNPSVESYCLRDGEFIYKNQCYVNVIDKTEPSYKCPDGYKYVKDVNEFLYRGYCHYLKNEWNGEKYIRTEDKQDAEFSCVSWKELVITDNQAYCIGNIKQFSSLSKIKYYCPNGYDEVYDDNNLKCKSIVYTEKVAKTCPYGYELDLFKECVPVHDIRKAKYTVEYECPDNNPGMPYILINKTCYNKVIIPD